MSLRKINDKDNKRDINMNSYIRNSIAWAGEAASLELPTPPRKQQKNSYWRMLNLINFFFPSCGDFIIIWLGASSEEASEESSYLGTSDSDLIQCVDYEALGIVIEAFHRYSETKTHNRTEKMDGTIFVRAAESIMDTLGWVSLWTDF